MLRPAQRGFSLIELVVGMGITALLIMIAAPNLREWIQNNQLRGAAESIQSGLQLARAEAVRRNTLVRFQFTTTTDNNCALSTAGPNWLVSLGNEAAASPGNPASHCGDPPSDTVAPFTLKLGAAAEGAANAVIAADQAVVAFNGWGRATVPVTINISNPVGGNCLVVTGGTMRCLRVTVSATGQIRICDPYITMTQPTDPGAC